jgi:hypothetical protein
MSDYSTCESPHKPSRKANDEGEIKNLSQSVLALLFIHHSTFLIHHFFICTCGFIMC